MMKTSQFTYRPVPRIMFAEASALPAADVGAPSIEVQSDHTGRIAFFQRTEVVRDVEDDILHWIYEPVDTGVPCNVEKLYIFND